MGRGLRFVVFVCAASAAVAGPATAGFAKAAHPDAGTNGSVFVSQSPPSASVACGATAPVTVTFTNSGTSTWTTGKYHLVSADPVGNTNFGSPTEALSSKVPPGASTTFSWTAQLPSVSGTWSFSWQMENGTTRFGQVSPAATVTTSCPLSDVFGGAARFVLDDSFTFSDTSVFWARPGQPNHVDESVVQRNGTWYMFFRTFTNPDGSRNTNGVPAGIALATSSDGNSWQVQNSGRPVIAARPSSLQTGSSCDPTPGQCILTAYAPSAVVLPDGRFVMAYEVMDTGVGPNTDTPRNWIAAATSSDGTTWAPVTDAGGAPARVLVPTSAWEGYDAYTGDYPGGVGTPILTYDAPTTTYTLSYHGLSTSNTFARGFATGQSLSALSRYGSNPVMTGGSGWMSTGPGKADDTREGAYWYRVFEAFSGGPSCGVQGTEVGWGLARSTDRVHWAYSSVNPLRTDRIDYSCGEDMPAWEVVAGRAPMVITTNIGFPLASAATIHRYRLVERSQPTTTAPVVGLAQAAGANHQAGYWQLDSSGGVTGHGMASYGSASGSGYVSITNGPQDAGYWVLNADGTVSGFGSAASRSYGDLRSLGLDDAVSIGSTYDQGGYWIALATGRVYAFGDAVSLLPNGSTASPPAQPVVMLTPSVGGHGYWLVDRGGGVYAFGDAPNYGGIVWPNPVVGLTVRSDGNGYWITDDVGNNLTLGPNTGWYGDAHGYQPEAHLRITAVGPYATGAGNSEVNPTTRQPDQTNGYFEAAVDGGVINFGAAPYYGSVKGPSWNA